MSEYKRKRRFVDAHMHLWDTRAHDWYRFPVPGNDSGMGLTAPFPNRYLWEAYRASTSAVELTKCVHVTAVTFARDVEAESRWIGIVGREHPELCAIVGAVDLSQSLDTIIGTLDREMADSRFRGIRLLDGLDYEGDLAKELLGELARRNLVYDVVTHSPGGIAKAAQGLKRHESLVVALEHTGWPMSVDREHFADWQCQIRAFAELPNAHCKLSGLGMVSHSIDRGLFGDYFAAAIDAFGPDRCMFGSNFPVDLCYGSGSALLDLFIDFAGSYSALEQDQLLETTAERVYRI